MFNSKNDLRSMSNLSVSADCMTILTQRIKDEKNQAKYSKIEKYVKRIKDWI